MPDEGLQPQRPDAGDRSRFNTTQWSVIHRARDAGSADARAALGSLFEAYRYPLYAFARRRGHGDHDADDLVQGFFAHLMNGAALGSVAPEKGRFRAFLLAAFTNFVANQRRAATALRRGGAHTTSSLAAADLEARYERGAADHQTPEALFERGWVESLLMAVRARLADDYRAAGREQLFALLEPHLGRRDDAGSRAEVCRELGLSPAAVAMSLHRMRRRYGDLLRAEVARTVDDPADVEQELRDLMAIVARPA